MKCGKCGRKLKDTKSIEQGYGPVCWGKISGITKTEKHRSISADIVSEEDANIPGQMGFHDFPGFMPEIEK